jgi:transcription elongation factor Elf1
VKGPPEFMTEFEKALAGIKKSTESLDFSCPHCKQDKRRFVMQALCYDENQDAMVDVYTFACGACGGSYQVTSKPLGHMTAVAEHFKKGE